MDHLEVESIAQAITYMEGHLHEKLDLETVAGGVHYSKYHLHRMFTNTLGITLHEYIQRRRLTEAAKLLVFSRKPILEIALMAGYESQQAFTGIFKVMYKQTPLQYREQRAFYPLQLELTLHGNPSAPGAMVPHITYVTRENISAWMGLVALVIDGFPCLNEDRHREGLRGYIERREALLMWDREVAVGGAAFSRQRGSIDFLGVHPQYRLHGIGKALLDFILCHMPVDREISITTFREGDRADTGQREAYTCLGFAEAELMTEFGYPVQRLILQPRREFP